MNVLPDLIKTNIEDQSLMCHSKQKIFWRQYNIKTKERHHSENRKKNLVTIQHQQYSTKILHKQNEIYRFVPSTFQIGLVELCIHWQI